MQKNAPSLQKDAINPHFGNKYISLDTLMPQILPLLNEHGLLLLQWPTALNRRTTLGPGDESTVELGTQPALRTKLVHVPSGESMEDVTPLVLDKDNSQGLGSAITYTRRYALLSILGLVADVDDDGERASNSKSKAKPRGAAKGGKPEVVNKPGKNDNEESW